MSSSLEVFITFVIGGWVVHRGMRAAEDSRGGLIQSVDGAAQLYYQESGEGPALIAPGHLFLHESLAPLTDEYKLVSYDMRNRGRSSAVGPEASLTIQGDVEDLETVRHHRGIDQFTAVGYSYLGLMVILYAIRSPQHVDRIVQLGPIPPRFGTEYPPDLRADDLGGVPDPVEMAKLDALGKEGFGESHPKEYCEKRWAVERFKLVGDPRNVDRLGNGWCELPNERPSALSRHFRRLFPSIMDLRVEPEDLQRVTVPVLTIHGTRDRNAPYGGGVDWARMLPNARLLTVQGGAHQSFCEYPEIVLPAIRTFLGGDWPKDAKIVR